MRDPVGDRLRDYYRSIENVPPERLAWTVKRRFDGTSTAGRIRWQPMAGLAGLALVAVVAVFVLSALGPLPAPSPSVPVAGSNPPSSSSSAGPTPSAAPSSMEPSSQTPTPTPTPTTAPTPTPGSGTGSFGKAFANSLGRDQYTVTLLSGSGKVLIAGGIGSGNGGPIGRLTAAQIWDPGTGRFTTTGSMLVPHYQHTATLLLDGRVLIAGGADMSDGTDDLASAELYDPATGKFTMTGSMHVGRARATATLLLDGRVLIAGGANTVALAEAELYDPATGRFTVTGSMGWSRERFTATMLDDGRVLVAGGLGSATRAQPEAALASAETFDPAAGRFTATEPLNAARYDHAAAATHNSSLNVWPAAVIVAGGLGSNGHALDSAEVFTPSQNNFGRTSTPMSAARGKPTAAELTAGFVLIIGASGSKTTADAFDPSTGLFASLVSAGAGAGQTATPLNDNNCRALLSGPGGKSWEVFTPTHCQPAT